MVTSGLKAWIVQRISAVYLFVFFTWFLGGIWINPPAGHQDWLAWVGRPHVKSLLLLAVFALLFHAWVGVRDVLMDYVPSLIWRSVCLVLLLGSLFVMGFWMLAILLRI